MSTTERHSEHVATGPAFRWLVTDLDGTLVDRSLRIVQRSAEALRRFRDAGGEVVIATGRNEESAGRSHSELGLDTPMILYNGARIVDPLSGDRLLDLGMSWPLLRDHVLPRLPADVSAVGFAGSHSYVLRSAPTLADYARRDRIHLREDTAVNPMTKVMLIADKPGVEHLVSLVCGRLPGVRILQSESTYLELLPAEAGKGAALRLLAERRGVRMDEVAAILDNPNDIDMLLTARLGAAVGDGHPSVREVADVVVSGCADGGVADLVDLLLAAV